MTQTHGHRMTRPQSLGGAQPQRDRYEHDVEASVRSTAAPAWLRRSTAGRPEMASAPSMWLVSSCGSGVIVE